MSGIELVVLGATVAVAAFIQGSIGFAFALISVPILALLEPAVVPGAVLLLALPLNVWVLARERGHIDRRGATVIVAGMLVGTGAGVVVLRGVPEDLLAIAFGAAVVLAAGVSAVHAPERFGDGARAGLGAGSGLINTVASTGGPLVALMYARSRGPELRSTLAATFLISSVLALGAQAAAERLGMQHVKIAAAMLPALAVGTWASNRGRGLVDERWLRPAVLVFAAVSGVAAIVRALL